MSEGTESDYYYGIPGVVVEPTRHEAIGEAVVHKNQSILDAPRFALGFTQAVGVIGRDDE